jgi:ubiquinone/menaquinone biosynthesis C-methylase UbiE
MKEDPSLIFIHNWKIYRKVIESDYMSHRQIGSITRNVLKTFSASGPLDILDLGCGDADQLATVIREMNVSSYTGIDLSPQAIEIAKTNLSPLSCSMSFRIGKMEEEIKLLKKEYNLIFSSFAIHHLWDKQKQSFIEECFRRTSSNGLFMLIDIKRQPGQTIEQYKSAYTHLIRSEWHQLSSLEKESIIAHLQECDFPVEMATYTQWALESGFQFIEEALTEDLRHGLLVFKKP